MRCFGFAYFSQLEINKSCPLPWGVWQLAPCRPSNNLEFKAFTCCCSAYRLGIDGQQLVQQTLDLLGGLSLFSLGLQLLDLINQVLAFLRLRLFPLALLNLLLDHEAHLVRRQACLEELFVHFHLLAKVLEFVVEVRVL